MIRLWVRTPSRSYGVAVDVDADGVAHLHTSGKKWSFRVGEGGYVQEVSDHPKAAAGREDAREISFRAFEMMLAS